MCTFLLKSGALVDIEQVHSGICELCRLTRLRRGFNYSSFQEIWMWFAFCCVFCDLITVDCINIHQSQMIASLVQMKQPWEIWIKKWHECTKNWWYNQKNTTRWCAYICIAIRNTVWLATNHEWLTKPCGSYMPQRGPVMIPSILLTTNIT